MALDGLQVMPQSMMKKMLVNGAVTGRKLTSYEELLSVTAQIDLEIVLPEKIKGFFNDGTTEEFVVTWDELAVQKAQKEGVWND